MHHVHCCASCREEAVCERCPNYETDWEDDPVDLWCPTEEQWPTVEASLELAA